MAYGSDAQSLIILATLQAESVERREQFISLLLPFVLCGFHVRSRLACLVLLHVLTLFPTCYSIQRSMPLTYTTFYP